MPNPRLAAPGSIPITTCMGTDSGRKLGCLPLGDLLEDLLGNVEVGVHRVDVVVLFERVDQTEQRTGVALAHLNRALRLHRHLGRADLDAGLFERLAYRAERPRLAEDPELLTVLADVVGAGVDRRQHVVLPIAGAVDGDDAALLEDPGNRSGLPEAAVVLAEGEPDVRGRAVAVVGERFDQDRRSAGPVALEVDLLDRVGVGARAGAAVDRPLDVLLGHRGVLRLLHGGRQGRIAVDVPPAVAGGDDDRPGQLREQLAPFCVGRALLVFDRGPLRMTRHACHSMETVQLERAHSHSISGSLAATIVFLAMLLAALSLWTALPLTWVYIGSKV